MIFCSLLETQTFTTCHLDDLFLQRIRKPNVEERNWWHQCKPESCIVDRTCSIVSMHGEQTTNGDTPLDGFESSCIFEDCLHLKSVILSWLLFWVIVEEIFIRRLVVSDVLSTELMYLCYIVDVCLGTLIEVFRNVCSFPYKSPLRCRMLWHFCSTYGRISATHLYHKVLII